MRMTTRACSHSALALMGGQLERKGRAREVVTVDFYDWPELGDFVESMWFPESTERTDLPQTRALGMTVKLVGT